MREIISDYRNIEPNDFIFSEPIKAGNYYISKIAYSVDQNYIKPVLVESPRLKVIKKLEQVGYWDTELPKKMNDFRNFISRLDTHNIYSISNNF